MRTTPSGLLYFRYHPKQRLAIPVGQLITRINLIQLWRVLAATLCIFLCLAVQGEQFAPHAPLAPLAPHAKKPHSLTPQAHQNKVRFNTLKNRQLDSIGDIYAIIQDRQGFMWFGGLQGLARYDGYTFKLYRYQANKPLSLSDNRILDLLVDNSGQLWVATGNGANRYNTISDDFTRFVHDPHDPTSIGAGEVWSMLQDSMNTLWLGTSEGGLNRFQAPFRGDGGKFDRIALHANQAVFDGIGGLFEDKQGIMWMGCYSSMAKIGGICTLPILTMERVPRSSMTDSVTFAVPVTFYPFDPRNPNSVKSIGSEEVSKIYEDSEGHVWIATVGGGLNRFDRETKRFVHYRHKPDRPTSLGHDQVRTVLGDSHDNLWIGTDKGGLNRLNWAGEGEGEAVFDRYLHHSDDPGSIASDSVRSIYEDRFKGLWLGHFPSGVSISNDYASAFHNFYSDTEGHDPSNNTSTSTNNKNSLSHSSILAIAETALGDLWVGTEKGLNHINRQTGEITRYYHKPKDPLSPSGLPADAVLALLIDSQGVLWVGTHNGGLSRFDVPADYVPTDKALGTFTHYRSEPGNPFSLSDNRVWSLYEDRDTNLWVGTASGLHRYQALSHTSSNTGKATFIRYQPNANDPSSIPSGWVRCLLEDTRGDFWVGTGAGLSLMDRNKGVFQNYLHSEAESGGIGAGGVLVIHEDKKGRLWLGLQGGGINRFDRLGPPFFKKYHLKDGLPDAFVTGILEDNQGALWLSTGYGVSQFNPDTERFRNYNQDHGLAGNVHNRSAYLKTAKGELVFGSTEGLTIFDPESVFVNKVAPPIVITDFRIANKSVAIDFAGLPLQSSLMQHSPLQHKAITLNHKQSVFSFEFAALNYRFPHMNEYAYKLQGFDQQWTYSGTKRTATYTNLDPGHYVFKVKGSNNEGVWSEKGTEVAIHILPPWWLTWWAKIAYVVLFIFLLSVFIYTYLQRKRVQAELQLNRKLQELDKAKDSFLANTSHELRTPLNGIIGLSESLIDGLDGPPGKVTLENLKLIVNSGKRLSYLISDILDFSKLREHSVQLNRSAVDLFTLVDQVCQLSQPLIGTKPVTLINKVDKYQASIRADENRLQQILYNLVGNAIKFTDTGTVTISTSIEGSSLWMAVSDTGIGIPSDQLDKVFGVFEQVNREHNTSGTGLGLAVTQQLVELHGGKITLTSEQGKGTTARFSLSVSNQAIQEGALRSQEDINDEAGGASFTERCADEDISSGGGSESERVNDGPHILVVDDEVVNRKVLFNLLSLRSYRVSECSSGKQALALLIEASHDFDLVLLDVMMPGMTGYQVCKAVREVHSASHLPVVFLTAKSQVSDLQEGYEAGGNDFLTKPIAKEELFSRINTHLKLLTVNRRIELEVARRTQQLADSHEQLDQAYGHLKQTQSQLVQSEKMSSLGTLVAGVGHEINNPLNFSNLAAVGIKEDLVEFETLLKDLTGEGNDAVLDMFQERFENLFSQLSTLHEGTKRITDVVNNLRTFSRSDAESMTPSSVSAGLLSTLELVKANYKTDIEFICDIQDDPEISCNPSELNQVFMNLMVNACQAMGGDRSQGARLAITMKQAAMKQVSGELCISFKDTGCGMSQEIIGKIFEPFFTTKPDGEGTGLGMAISYGIIERHKGRIEVLSFEGNSFEGESQEGEADQGSGTTINVYLPSTIIC